MNQKPESNNVEINDNRTEPKKQNKKNLYNTLKVVAKEPFAVFVRRGSRNAGAKSTFAEHDDDYAGYIQQTSLDKEVFKTTKSNKCVSFATVPSTRSMVSWRDFSAHEISAAWFTRDEYISMQRSCCKEIIKLDNGERLKDKKYCARGLECHTRYGRLTKKRNRTHSILVVLEVQDSHVRDGLPCDDEAIARVYHDATSSCQLWAAAVGLVDARAAEEVDDILGGDICSYDDVRSVTTSSKNCKYYTPITAYAVSSSRHSRGGEKFTPHSCLAVARSA
jgi:hypothetical protein